MDFDEAIALTGYGRFHYTILFVCAISVITVGFQNGLSSYIFPVAQCELNLTSSYLGYLNISFLIGGALSSFLWGVLADYKGRKRILALAHLINALSTIICSVTSSIITLILLRFLNGFFIGAPGSIIFSYLSEFQPRKYRASVICYTGLFFTSSWLLLPVLAWLVLPLNLNYHLSFFIMSSWRLFLIIVSAPEILVGISLLKLPESPKFLIASGNPRKALQVLRKIFAVNTGKLAEDFPVKALVTKIKSENNLPCRGKSVRVLDEILQQFRKLFRAPLLAATVLTSAIMFTNMFGIFGLGLWLPEFFIRFEQFHILYPNESVSVKQLAILNEIKNISCTPSFDAKVFQNTAAMGVSSIFMNFLSGYLARKVPLRLLTAITMTLGGLSTASIYWLRSSIQNLIVASIFQSTMLAANIIIGNMVLELFPTNIGAMAICFTMCAGRLGAMVSNFMFGFFMDEYCEIPIFAVAGSVLIGAGLSTFIPRQSKPVVECNNSTSVAVVSLDTKL